MTQRGIRNLEVARALKTGDATVSRWRSGVMPRESSRRAIIRAINRKPGFPPITAADLGWPEKEVAGV